MLVMEASRSRWFDTHVHLDRYPAHAAAAMLDRATSAGVDGLLAVSTSLSSSERTVGLPARVWKAVGIHPVQAGFLTFDAWKGSLRRLSQAQGVVAIGETGFDAAGPGWPLQRACLIGQASLAHELGLALVLHIDGDGAWHQLLGASSSLQGLRVIRHYFQGGHSEAEWHAARGHFLSFGRPLLRDAALQSIATSYPAELLLIETDTYPLPGRATEPQDLIPVGHLLARLRGWTFAACAQQLWENTCRALRLDEHQSPLLPR